MKTTAGEIVVDVKIRRDISGFIGQGSAGQRGSLETLEINAPWLDEQLQTITLPQDDEMVHFRHLMFAGHPYTHPENIAFEMFRVQHVTGMDPAAPRREGVLVTSGSVKMAIMSSSAFEYYWDDSNS